MVLGVPEGAWVSYCMLDDEFEDPTIEEMSQVHIRKAVFAVHPSRGQWVRDAEGRLGVLAADADWRNDPLYNSMLSVNNGGVAAPANGAGFVPAAAPVGAVHAPAGANAQPVGAAAGPFVFDLTESDDEDQPLAAGPNVIDLTGSVNGDWEVIMMN